MTIDSTETAKPKHIRDDVFESIRRRFSHLSAASLERFLVENQDSIAKVDERARQFEEAVLAKQLEFMTSLAHQR